jgi:hypothetical protein
MILKISKNNKAMVNYIFRAYVCSLIFLTLKNERNGKKSCFGI